MRAQVRVNRDALRLRVLPSKKARVLRLLDKGEILDLECVEGDWVGVYDPNKTGHSGYVWRAFVDELPPPQPDVLRIDPPAMDNLFPNKWFRSWGDLVTTGLSTLFLVGVALSVAAVVGALLWLIFPFR